MKQLLKSLRPKKVEEVEVVKVEKTDELGGDYIVANTRRTEEPLFLCCDNGDYLIS